MKIVDLVKITFPFVFILASWPSHGFASPVLMHTVAVVTSENDLSQFKELLTQEDLQDSAFEIFDKSDFSNGLDQYLAELGLNPEAIKKDLAKQNQAEVILATSYYRPSRRSRRRYYGTPYRYYYQAPQYYPAPQYVPAPLYYYNGTYYYAPRYYAPYAIPPRIYRPRFRHRRR